MQTLLNCGFAAVLLEIHHLFEVDLGLAVALLGLRVGWLLVVAHAFLALLHAPHVLHPSREGEDGLRVGAVLLLGVGLVGVGPAHGVVLGLLALRRTSRPARTLPLFAPIFAEGLRLSRETHVMLVNLLVLESGAILGSSRGVVGGLGGDAAEGEAGIAELVLEYLFVAFMLNAFGGGEDAGPVVGVAEFDGGVAEVALLPVDLLQQFVRLLLGLLPVLVELLLVFLELRRGWLTRTTKLLIRRLYFSSSTGRTWFWQAAFHCRCRRSTNSPRSAYTLAFRNTNELYIDKLQQSPYHQPHAPLTVPPHPVRPH